MVIIPGPIHGVKRNITLIVTWLLGAGPHPAFTSATPATTSSVRTSAAVLGVSGSCRTLVIEPLVLVDKEADVN